MKKLIINDHKAVSWNKIYSSNSKWIRKKIADNIHEMVWYSCKEANLKPAQKFPQKIKIVAEYKNKYRRDADNICSKVYIDGLVMAEILPDDDYRYINEITKKIKVGCDQDKVIIYIKQNEKPRSS